MTTLSQLQRNYDAMEEVGSRAHVLGEVVSARTNIIVDDDFIDDIKQFVSKKIAGIPDHIKRQVLESETVDSDIYDVMCDAVHKMVNIHEQEMGDETGYLLRHIE